MAAERGTGQQQSQEMMEGEWPRGAATEGPSGWGRRPVPDLPERNGAARFRPRLGPRSARRLTSASRQGGGGPGPGDPG